MLAALRYRRAQTIVVVVLAALVTTCLVLAPLYTRALEQAMIRMMLREATVAQTGLRLGSTSPTAPQDALDPDALEQLLPESLRTFVGSPTPSTGVDVRKLPFAAQPGGRLLNRAGMCEHVTITDGHCPSARGEVAVSADQVKAYGTPVGSTIEVGEFDGAVSSLEGAPRTTLRVVGVYDQVDGPSGSATASPARPHRSSASTPCSPRSRH